MPTPTQRFLCWALFTATMAALGWALSGVVPPAMSAAYGAVGHAPILTALFLTWCAAAYVGWGPSVRTALARRRRPTVRQ